MAWNLYKAAASFGSLRDRWDAINKESGNHVLLDSLFWQPLLDHFGSSRIYVAVNEGDLGKSIALVEPGGRGFWRTFQPSQAPIGPICFDGLSSTHWPEHVSALISSLPGFALGFSVTQQDPDFTCFTNLNGSPAVETVDYIQTPRLAISGSFDAYWNSRSKNLTHNLSRQRRRLKAQGLLVELAIDREPQLVGNALAEYGRLESTGWKAKEGTAVASNNAQGWFYQQMLQAFCSRGEGVIYRLLLNGKTVASDLCLERNGTMVILKTAYDESVQGLSLGLLLHEEILKSLFQGEKTRVIEFYGPLKEWHTKWTDEVRTMYHINVYRHRWVGTARRWVKNTFVNVKLPLSYDGTHNAAI